MSSEPHFPLVGDRGEFVFPPNDFRNMPIRPASVQPAAMLRPQKEDRALTEHDGGGNAHDGVVRSRGCAGSILPRAVGQGSVIRRARSAGWSGHDRHMIRLVGEDRRNAVHRM